MSLLAPGAAALLLILRAESAEDALVKFVIAVLGVLSVGLAALLTYVLNRKAAKHAPKTEMRARVYGEFVKFWLCDRNAEGECGTTGRTLNEILARLVVYGKDEVISQVALLLEEPESVERLKNVIAKMRDGVQTSDGEEVMKSIEKILLLKDELSNRPKPAPQ